MSKLTKFRVGRPPSSTRLLGDGRAASPNATSTVQGVIEHYATRAEETGCLLLFDATSSMQPYWNHVCGTLHHIVDRLLAVHRHLALRVVAYRDDCDGDRIIEDSGWSGDADPLARFVGRVRCAGGGDWPEAVDCALQVAVNEQQPVTAVVLIGDAPPHERRDGLAEARQLKAQGRPVFPIVVGGAADTRQAFQAIASVSGGRLVDLEKLDELYDVLGVVLAHSAGPGVMADYMKRYGGLLGPGARRAVRMLTDGRS